MSVNGKNVAALKSAVDAAPSFDKWQSSNAGGSAKGLSEISQVDRRSTALTNVNDQQLVPARVDVDVSPKKNERKTTMWRQKLRKEDGDYLRDEENIRIILARDPELSEVVRFNEFSGELQLSAPIPTDEEVDAAQFVGRPWTDADTVVLTAYIQRTTLPTVARDRVEAVLRMHAQINRSYHPLEDYLTGLQWDGRNRVQGWLFSYMNATGADSKYIDSIGTSFLIGAVARVLRPGCQADSVLVCEGKQGLRKSSAFRVLASDDWFSDSLPGDLHHKDAKDHLRGKWIVELPELAQLKRNEIETLKAFLTRREEKFRPSYGRHEIVYRRQCVFTGSTNEDEYLVDTTGNRRFWCVKVGDVELEALVRDRDQLWAEAVVLYRAGTPWHLTGEIAQVAEQEAAGRITADPWANMVLELAKTDMLSIEMISPGEMMERIGLTPDQRHARGAARMGTILRGLGWKRGPRHRIRGQLYVVPCFAELLGQ